jgi:hypothetical protein
MLNTEQFKEDRIQISAPDRVENRFLGQLGLKCWRMVATRRVTQPTGQRGVMRCIEHLCLRTGNLCSNTSEDGACGITQSSP